MTLQHYRPDGKGGIEARPVTTEDWRGQLRSRRWGEALPKGRLPGLVNPEMDPTSIRKSVLTWLGLAALTFVILVAGYGSGFWSFGG